MSMQISRGLATTITEFQDFLDELGAAANGALGRNDANSLYLIGSDAMQILIKIRYDTNDTDPNNIIPFANPRVLISYGGYETALIGSSLSSISFAYEIRSSSSGDVLVKFAQWTDTEKLDIIPESFQSWGIAAYGTSDPSVSVASHTADFLVYHSLGDLDLLAGRNYGGFLLHKMRYADSYGITVFNRDGLAPIYTWAAGGHLCSEGGNSYINRSGLGSYTELKRRYRGFVSGESNDHYLLYVQEPYDRPKRPSHAILAPIFTPSVEGDYSKNSRWLMQSPHMYNPFDSDGYVLIDGGDGGAFYSDHGVCLSAAGDSIVDTGEVLPSPNIWLHYRIGDYSHDNIYSPGIYGEIALNYDGSIYEEPEE